MMAAMRARRFTLRSLVCKHIIVWKPE
jgi:hypothetical protein